METGKLQVFEWKIENISCWREDVHGESIESPNFSFSHFEYVTLYPIGFGDDRITVSVFPIKSDFTGDLSFIGPDGSLIYSQQVIGKRGGIVSEGGPEFEETVALMRKNDDILILRFCFPSEHDHVQHMCTTIGVSNVSLKMDPELIESVESEYISFISHSEQKDCEGLALKTIRTDETIELVFDPANKRENDILVECSVSLLKSDNSLVRHEEKKEHVFRDGEPWTFSDPLNVEELVEKDISILIQVKISNGTINNSYNHLLYDSKGVTIEPVTSSPNDDSKSELKRDFTGLYQNPDFSDFRLECDNVSFPVHRAILSARSPVLKTMFSSDMREAASGCMDIVDLDAPTLACFLTFLYTGALEDLQEDSALKLYYAADKYQVPTLKRECVHFLRANVTISNVCDVLSLADRHQDGELISAVHDFILSNLNEVSRSEEWNSFVKREPVLAAETWTNFAAEAGVGKINLE